MADKYRFKKLTPFAIKVYKTISKIPLGQVRSYKWVAHKSGKPKASRAVGQILKNNPLPLIIPCHRVIRCNGKPGGYIFGKRTKQGLLNLERKLRQLMI